MMNFNQPGSPRMSFSAIFVTDFLGISFQILEYFDRTISPRGRSHTDFWSNPQSDKHR